MSEQWINKTEIKSESSNRIYTVSQHVTKRHWACSCPAWRTKRTCKHLKQLNLPGNEQPHELNATPTTKAKTFMDVYKKTYDTGEGFGGKEQWQQALSKRMGIEEARKALNLSTDAGWDEVRQVFHMAATESLAILINNFEQAAQKFDGTNETQATAVQNAKFRVEAYSAYLDEQRQKLEMEVGRITGDLLAKIQAD